MALTERRRARRAGHIVRRRLPGPDVVRAVALIGVVVMNFHGYLLLADDRRRRASATDGRPMLFDPWNGPLSTRFAATFVLVAGVGVTLLTRSVIGDHDRVRGDAVAARRAAACCCTSSAWCSTSSGRARSSPTTARCSSSLRSIFTLRTRWIVAIGVAAALAGWTVRRVDRLPAGRGRPRHALADRARHRIRSAATCSTCSSTGPIRCCRGSRSCARASSSGGV